MNTELKPVGEVEKEFHRIYKECERFNLSYKGYTGNCEYYRGMIRHILLDNTNGHTVKVRWGCSIAGAIGPLRKYHNKDMNPPVIKIGQGDNERDITPRLSGLINWLGLKLR